MRNNDAVLWEREEFVGLDHKMLWFEGKKQTKSPVNVTNHYILIGIYVYDEDNDE